MSTTIDNRVVEMTFNNRQFESGAKETLSTLEKLKASLNIDSAAQSLSRNFTNIERSLSLSGISAGVDSISDRFSSLGVVGMTVLSNLTTSAMNLASRLGGLVVNPIVEGGKTRAQNIEHAKFQLEGLKVAWDDIEKDISYGVQDTAYGLDAAATVASQLVASNVQLGDSMKTALRGVSGVAAMTSSSYEEIGHIFTTVAGQGRLMGMQLTQLSMKGINAAATLGEALGKSEAEIRDMVSKGQIDFATFAKAMDDAYGAHAKDANKIFTGALSNTRAALARIGAKFATPAYDNLKDALNSLIPVINGINAGLDPFVEFVSKEMKAASTNVSKLLKSIDEKKLKSVGSLITNSVKSLKNVKGAIVGAAKPLKEAFTGIFSGSALDSMNKFSKKLSDVTGKFKITDDKASKLKTTFEGLFGTVKLFGESVSGVISRLTPLANKASDIFDPILDKLSDLGNKVKRVVHSVDTKNFLSGNLDRVKLFFTRDFSRLSGNLNIFLNNAKSLFAPFSGGIEKVAGAVKSFFSRELTNDQLTRISLFSKIVGSLGETLLNVGTAIARAARPIGEAIAEMFPSVSALNVLSVARSLSEFTEKLIVSDKTAGNIRNTVKGFLAILDIAAQVFSAIIRTLFPTADGFLSLGEGILSASGGLGEWLVSLDSTLRENDSFYNALQKLIELVKTGFETAKEKVIEFAEVYEEKTGKELKMPTIEDAFDFFDKMKETFSWVPGVLEKVKTSFMGFTDWLNSDGSGNKAKAIDTIVKVLDKLSAISGEISPDIGTFFSGIGEAFDKIDFERMGKIINIGMFIVFINALIKLRGVLSSIFSYGRPLHNFNGVLVGAKGALSAFSNNLKYDSLVKIAQAVGILSASLIALSMVDEKRLTSAMGAMASLFIELFGAIILVDKLGITKLGGSLVGFSLSVAILAGAITILSAAVIMLGELEPQQLASGLMGVLSLLSAVTLVTKFLPEGAGAAMIPLAGGLVILAGATAVLARALKLISNVENAWESLAILVTGLAALTAIGILLGNFAEAILSASVGIVVLAGSLGLLIPSLIFLGKTDLIGLCKGLLALTAAMILFGGTAAILGTFSLKIIAFAASMTVLGGSMAVMTGALALLVPVMTAFGNMDLAAIGKSLLIFASVIVIFGVAAALLSPIIPAMLGFVGSLLALGAAFAVLGAGMAALGVGITLLSTASMSLIVFILGLGGALVALVESVTAVGMALLVGLEELAPKIVDVAFKILVSIAVALAKYLPIIEECGAMLILGLLTGIESHLDDILIITGIILLKLLNGLSIILPSLVNAGIELIIKFINGMANAIRDNAEPLMAALRNLVASIIEFAVTALQQLARNIPIVGNTVYEGMEDVKALIRESIAPETMEDIGYEGAKGLSKGISSASSDAKNAASGLGDGITAGLSSLFQDFNALGSGLGEDFSNALSGTDGMAFNAADQLGSTAFDGLDLDFSSLGLSSGGTYAAGLLDTEGDVADSSNGLAGAANDQFNAAMAAFTQSGSDNGTSYTKGIESKKNEASKSGSALSGSSVDAINSKYGDFRSAGSNAGSGFALGLFNDSRAEVYDAASNLAQVALNSMMATLKEHSPSKATRQIGAYGGDGLAGGFLSKLEVVKDAAKLVAEQSLNALKDSMTLVSDYLSSDIDVDPVIRPVVDLTDVMNGSAAISGMMSSGGYNLGSVGSRISAANANAFSRLTTGSASDSSNGYAKVVGSINELRQDVEKLKESMGRRQVVLDSGALVGYLIDPIDNALGSRAKMKGRSV